MQRVNLKFLIRNPHGRLPTMLATLRDRYARSAPLHWSLVGGVACGDETTEEAAHRLLADRVGLTGLKLTCLHEWVQAGLTSPIPTLRSLWTADTDAGTEDLTINTLEAGAFLPLHQVRRLRVTDTTAVALRLVLPDLIPTFQRAPPPRAVLIDLASKPGTAAVAEDLFHRGYLVGVVADPDPASYLGWPSHLPTGADQTSDATVLRVGHPNPDQFRAAAKRLGVNPEDCVFVSADRLTLVAAAAAGMVPVRLAAGRLAENPSNARIHADMEPWPVIRDLAHLVDLLW